MIPIATATVAYSQTFGAALFISLSQITFLTLLRPALRTHAPNINAQDVINTSATNSLAKLSAGANNADTRSGVLLAYNQAVTRTFYLAVICGVCAFVTSLGLGKTKAETKKEKKNNDAENRIENEEKDESRSGLEGSERSKNETGPHGDSVNSSPQPSRMAS
ncbi:uncharacterized protein Z519_12507 [Cladophialophora bantiana CBS 173.52]|uniref:Major facilitator superfamily (MFS) profile domain-containing protein n=1 Tax=Cladophialophora bantiana (strain ATCC 10958 / CBS 173.52 / CDC B-1940 / NIH 8579) TaxID=1442370 RepID=A0A0D2E9U4_CLAB1|nr:uncharacterized protein Z519_12507 [Cladophialophora bantiana CBS 173.52]KIW86886.1 hypothetical protein Z519_12507 [Cladophialophora bantiana CBS 173.52]